MESATNPTVPTKQGMDWNIDLGEGKKDELNEFLDGPNEYSPLPFENLSPGSNASSNTSSNTSSDKASVPTREVPSDHCSEPISSSKEKTKLQVTSGLARKPSKKRPKDYPKPPLSAYNIFFQKHRPQMMKECSKSQRLVRGELGKAMGKKWRSLSNEERKKYEDISEADLLRHREEMKAYREARRKKFAFENNLVLPSMDCYSQNRSTVSHSSDSSSSEQGHVGIACRPTKFAVVSPSSSSLPPKAQIPRRQKLPKYLQPSKNFVTKSKRECRPYRHNLTSAMVGALPADSEVFLPDGNGIKKKYYVTYKCHRMTRTEAHDYMQRVAKENKPNGPFLKPTWSRWIT